MTLPLINIVPYSVQIIQTLTTQNHEGQNPEVLRRVEEIRTQVQDHADHALHALAHSLDGVTVQMKSLQATSEEIKAAYAQVPRSFIQALKKAKKNIETFHRYQLPKNWHKTFKTGVSYGMRYSPLEKVGLYVPGGRALYPSTVLMNAIPAKIAGVQTCVITTPPRPDGNIAPQILVAADICGVSRIIKAGGAQAVFALAYGTESVPKVDKIVGPGNIYVTVAKQKVYGLVDIDKPAGPSEVLVYVEDPRYAAYAAAELLAQLEHDPLAVAVAVSTRNATLEAIQKELAIQLPHCKRREIIEQSAQQSALILAKNFQEAVDVINAVGSEHLVILTDTPQDTLPYVKHAGSIFLGPYTPVALGDYAAGPNHVLPTGGATRYASPLGVMDFMKFSSTLEYSKSALAKIDQTVKALTDMEGLDAHYRSVGVRTQHE